jgi:predicted O-methyltransferase YrrM
MLNNFKTAIELMGLTPTDCHPGLPRDKEFKGLGLGGGAISIEEAYFLLGVIAVVKPDVVLELGTAQGGSTIALGAILKDFGKGEVISVDLANTPPPRAFELNEKLDLPIKWECPQESLEYLNNFEIDDNKIYLVFSDTDIAQRPKEVLHVLNTFPEGTFIVVHDTSDLHPFGPMELRKSLLEDGCKPDIIELPSPRGISILRV